MSSVCFAEDPFNPNSWEEVQTDDVLATIVEKYESWPDSARLYKEHVSLSSDVTPDCGASVKEVQDTPGRYIVAVYPESPIVILAIAVTAVAIGLAFLFIDVNQASAENVSQSSPNNELNRRTNRPRPNARIPDIFGTVRSTPDLIGQPYRYYENNREVELTYMCIGRGEFDVADIRDGDTLVSDIPGSTVEIYSPNTSPNSSPSVTPQVRIGAAINEPVKTVFSSNSVNGQELRPPNVGSISNEAATIARSGTNGTLVFTNLDSSILGDRFSVGDSVAISGLVYNDGGTNRDLNGTYVISVISNNSLTFSTVTTVNSNWSFVTNNASPVNSVTNVSISVATDLWVGPFIMSGDTNGELVANFVARNGLYKRANNQQAVNATVELEYTALDSSGNPSGSAQTATVVLEGSGESTSTVARTLRIQTTHDGDFRVRARRTTDTDLGFSGTVVDEVRWQEQYLLGEVSQQNFGDVTTVFSKTAATPGALAIKERKFNLRVSRKIPVRESGGSFSEPQASSNAADIIRAVTLDEYIGRRTVNDLDLENIYDVVTEVGTYFGNTKMTEFNYTFDNTNFSYEQTIAAIAQTLFCIAYRRGAQLRLSFEKLTPDSVMLFNNRNKIPNREKRTYTFGNVERRDGVELEYVDPDSDTTETIVIPSDGSARNPKKITTVGIRTDEQARIHANRAWNKIQYQVVSVEFFSVGEALLLLQNDRVLVANNIRQDTQDGDIRSQQGLKLETSEVIDFGTSSSLPMYIQLSDKTTQVFMASPVVDEPYAITINEAPRLPLVTSSRRYTRSNYMVAEASDGNAEAFIIQEITPQSNIYETRIIAYNYDTRYYQNDQDERVS